MDTAEGGNMKVLKKVAIGAFALLITSPLASVASAKSTDKLVTASYLNIRSGPSTNSEILGSFKEGTKVNGEVENRWFKIKFNNKFAFLSLDHLKDIANKPAIATKNKEMGKNYRVIASYLNIRNLPTISSEILGSFPRNTLVKGKKVGDWLEIQFNGQKAYISANYLRNITISQEKKNVENKQNKATSKKSIKKENTLVKYVTAGVLNIRRTANTKYDPIGQLFKDDTVEGRLLSNNWFQIDYRGKKAYISANYLSDKMSNKSSTLVYEKPTLVKRVTTANLNARTGPSTNFPIVTVKSEGTLLEGTYYKKWFKVIEGNRTLYLSGDYLRKVASSDQVARSADNKSNIKVEDEGIETIKKLKRDLEILNQKGQKELDSENMFYLRKKTGLSPSQLNKIFEGSNLANLGEAFYKAEQEHGVNSLLLAAIGIHESAYGRSKIYRDKNNMFGIEAYDSSPYTSARKFASPEECIMYEARFLLKYYLSPGGRYYNGCTTYGINVMYASDRAWGVKVEYHMKKSAEKIISSFIN